MINYKRNFEYKIECGCIFAIMAIWLIIGTLLILWTDRNLDFWVSYIRGEEVDVPIGLSILAVLFGPFGIVFNVISEIARLCV